jgi:murein DD-endopeptidase MepM/ murein hydrolase activator NlpD
MGYVRPVDAPVSASWQDHKDRTPPSSEPGTDYACAYDTPVRCAGDGYVTDLTTSTAGGTGRFLTVDLDDGRRVRYLHLASHAVGIGWRVGRGQIIAHSGASGFGNNWGYAPHLHTTLFPYHAYDFDQTQDFEQYIEEDDMPLTPADKQIIKDSMFEFMRDTSGPPSGYESWPFMQSAVWNVPLQAQDADGKPLVDENGKPIKFSTSGYLVSTNAVTNALHTDPVQASVSKLVTPAWVGGIFLGLIGLVEVIRFVVDMFVS